MGINGIVEGYQKLGVKAGDILVVQSSFKNLSKLDCSPHSVIDALQDLVGKSGTLIMPAYNFKSWTEGHYFDLRETPSTIGLLPEMFRQSKGVSRTRHPIHSLSVRGALAEEMCQLDDIDSFGSKSVFDFLHRANAVYSSIGLGSEMPFLPCHFAETMHKVPYRRQKLFSGIYVGIDGQPILKTYGFHVREIGTQQNPVEDCHVILCDRMKIRSTSYLGININVANAQDYHNDFVGLIREKPELFAK